MAKQLINPVERHIEKLIVGIAGVMLIGAVVRYGVTSPNRIELGGEEVTPATIDERVALKASSIRDRIRSAQVDVEQPEPILNEFETSLAPLEAVALPWVAPPGIEPPIIDPPESPLGQKVLVQAVVPDAPVLTSGRSTLEVIAPSGAFAYPVVNWVTVSSLFNVKDQADVQKIAYGAQHGDVVTAPFEMQRRARRADGSWSPEDWALVVPSPAAPRIPVPSVALVQGRDTIMISSGQQNRINEYYERLSEPSVQLELFRPLMHETRNGTTWTFPLLTAYEDVLRQDDYYLYPDQLPTQFPEDRYGLREERDDAPASERKTVAQQITELSEQIKKARETCSPNLAVDAYNDAFDLARSNEATPGERQRAAQLQVDADQTSKDIERDVRLGIGTCGGANSVTGGDDGKVVRTPLPVQQFWLHDASSGSVVPGKTYEYRVRSNLFNQLAGDPTKFADPLDATRIIIASDWSEPSAALTVPPSVEFYVTSSDPRKEQVGVEIYQWAEGVWVKDRFKFGVGAAVQAVSRQKIPSFDDPTVADNAQIRFDAGATIVALDFERSFRGHKRGKSRAGFSIGSPQPACVVVLADADGRLYERFVPADKADPGKRAAAERVEQGERRWRGER